MTAAFILLLFTMAIMATLLVMAASVFWTVWKTEKERYMAEIEEDLKKKNG